jgi:hypothetical protein
MRQGGSCVHFVGGGGGLEIKESPEEVLPLLISQALQALQSGMASIGGLDGLASLLGED